jgi:transposase
MVVTAGALGGLSKGSASRGRHGAIRGQRRTLGTHPATAAAQAATLALAGRLPLDDRACLNGILFVLLTGIRWTDLPQQLGYGSGMTCWRRLRDWQAAGVWDQLHAPRPGRALLAASEAEHLKTHQASQDKSLAS